MPSAREHKSAEFVKLILIGASGAGKTGALASLALGGYKLRIIDLDSGLDALINHVKEKDESALDNIEFVTFRDKIKMGPTGPRVVGTAKAYVNTLGALEKWPDDQSNPAEWGQDTILVIDSLTNLGRAAMQWAKGINPTTKDPRQWYKTAQDLIEDLVANLTDDGFMTNVIVISHVELVEQGGLTKGYASSIGKALGPKLPRFFNTLLFSEIKGSGDKVKRTIKTIPTTMIDAKNPAPMRVKAEYSVEEGMLQLFRDLKNG